MGVLKYKEKNNYSIFLLRIVILMDILIIYWVVLYCLLDM